MSFGPVICKLSLVHRMLIATGSQWVSPVHTGLSSPGCSSPVVDPLLPPPQLSDTQVRVLMPLSRHGTEGHITEEHTTCFRGSHYYLGVYGGRRKGEQCVCVCVWSGNTGCQACVCVFPAVSERVELSDGCWGRGRGDTWKGRSVCV